ncbi:interferon-induced GTP-binding protein Mx [Paracoccidioides lutzii Pb01]|uniref:Interferon-induced GTP-binding protein Mx n=1 Tax=Paracoccidioides lutzii (strain ATCC MYA-826 / Pb01) TaxID=502779 RepID=C1HCZ8_PARBA|nr:interferon-induced GTP-binding protein Mx [Paracoccidioides lutzii Pb01]EEH39370.1 interferon-induced GTP-binding protein Mx [Paracoccidioides lutzii Pb01]
MTPFLDLDTPVPLNPPKVPLQSQEHRDLLDIIDKLRSQGINRYVDLPQIVVCGDQSSGKSSVLEAISGLSFPTKDNLCTGFATELILRRSPSSAINISIVPGEDRSEAEKEVLHAFSSSVSINESGLEKVVEDAKVAMGLSVPGSSRVFSNDILRVELSGPCQPHLTMVDLPSLFEAGNRDQSEEDAGMVKSLVLAYMKNPRSIILAVVSAKSDFALQSVTKYARNLDPQGMRTIGLITKPDTLDAGSDSEQGYLDMAQNKDVKFRLGWHVLRNRDFSTRDVTTAERDQIEIEFFSTGVGTSLNPAHVGVSALRPRLSHILRDQILDQLPSVLADVESGIDDCKVRLQKLGAPRADLQQQRQYLLHLSHAFHTNIKSAINGMYDGPFFGSAGTEGGYKRRLRAVVQNRLTSFAAEMRTKGHALKIVESGKQCKQGHITRSQYAKKVTTPMSRSRGRELPGTYNPLIVGELFREQCGPWKGVIGRFKSDILGATHYAVSAALDHAADEITAARLLHEIIGPDLGQLEAVLDEKIMEILEPHESGHPITYNHYLT